MCIAQNSYCECRKYSCKVIKIRNIVKSCPEQNFFTNSPWMFFFSDGIYLLFWWWLLLSKVKIVCLFTYILFILSHLGGVNDSKTLSTKETRDKHRPYEPSWLGEGFKIDFFIHLYMFFIYDNLFNNTLTFICLFFLGGGKKNKWQVL